MKDIREKSFKKHMQDFYREILRHQIFLKDFKESLNKRRNTDDLEDPGLSESMQCLEQSSNCALLFSFGIF